jgi:hypothetical protein
MVSKDHMTKVSVCNEPKKEVIFEGELGDIASIELVEGLMLQITGDNGVLRIDITENELAKNLARKKLGR